MEMTHANQVPPEAERPDDDEVIHLTRRVFIRVSGVAVIGAGITALTVGCGPESPATPTPIPTGEQYAVPTAPAVPPSGQTFRFFTRHEAATVEAYTARLMPGDASDPGAREAGVVAYIDLALSFNDGFDAPAYFQGPFAVAYEGDTPPASIDPTKEVAVKKSELPRYGYQSNLTPVQVYRQGILALDGYANSKFGKDFVDLSEGQQDTIIGEMEKGNTQETNGSAGSYSSTSGSGSTSGGGNKPIRGGAGGNFPTDATAAFTNPSAQDFFATLRTHTVQGMFSDPIYGGNRDFIGWKLVGFPGAQRVYTPRQMHTEGFPFAPQGLADLMPEGHGQPGGNGVYDPVSGGTRKAPPLPPIPATHP